MKGLEFPLISTEVKSLPAGGQGLTKRYNLNDPKERQAYFEVKAGDEIKKIRKYLENNTFVAFLIGKKNSGKSTYSVLFSEIFGSQKSALVSVGDIIREIHTNWDKFRKSQDFEELKRLYRGYISFEKAIDAFLGRSTEKLLPTEFVLALLKLHIAKIGKKAIFIDGLPRGVDQVSYSLYFRDLINFRDDPDLFILIDIPEAVIDERLKYRLVCPLCRSSRNLKLLPTSKIGFDEKKKKFYLLCDNPNCKGTKMEAKEGDELGIGPIRSRLMKDEEIIKTVFGLYGVPKILLRNHVSVKEASQYFDDYELTPEYVLRWDEKGKKVVVKEKPWSVKDDNGVESYSLLAAPVVVVLLKQLVEVLNI
jgi:adenylate kinase family enzyme